MLTHHGRVRVERRWRLGLAAIVGTGVLVVLAIAAVTCVGPPSYYSDKYAPAPRAKAPSERPAPILPVRQTEPHTCGYCSIAAIYGAYGLDADSQDLRFRLGTDKQLLNVAPDTVGTIPPDMLRVLDQDGFDATLALPAGGDIAQSVLTHLATGHPALALIKPDGWHWIVIATADDTHAHIVDSLHDEPYRRPHDWLATDVHAAILVRPKTRAGEGQERSATRPAISSPPASSSPPSTPP